jgi:hypothetical protein
MYFTYKFIFGAFLSTTTLYSTRLTTQFSAPCIAKDAAGNLYVVYGNDTTDKIYGFKYTTGTSTWSAIGIAYDESTDQLRMSDLQPLSFNMEALTDKVLLAYVTKPGTTSTAKVKFQIWDGTTTLLATKKQNIPILIAGGILQ